MTAGRARILISHKGVAKLMTRPPRIPLTHEEVKRRLEIRYELDELHAVHLMGRGDQWLAKFSATWD